MKFSGEPYEPFFGARRVALCDGNGIFHCEAVGERVLTRACYLAEDVKGTVGDDFGGGEAPGVPESNSTQVPIGV